MRKRRIVFLSGTRADFGKIKSLLSSLQNDDSFVTHIFVTGMHLLSKYGSTHEEIERSGFRNIHKFVNQNSQDNPDTILAKTIGGFSDYVKEIEPDLIVVHGDRIEALGAALVGSLNNILVAHIEGGEVSGTIDESIRHAVTKMSQAHFVANVEAQKRLLQLGERPESIFIIGSPDLDIMSSPDLPQMDAVRKRYNLSTQPYGVVIFHPVTTELELLPGHTSVLLDFLKRDTLDYVVIYPNNDPGSDVILKAYDELRGNTRFRLIPSMRFEYFLSLMKHSKLLVGNSSAGVREAPFYGVPSLNIGSRQHKRAFAPSIFHCDFSLSSLQAAMKKALSFERTPSSSFGSGESARLFLQELRSETFWKTPRQKYFVDLPELNHS